MTINEEFMREMNRKQVSVTSVNQFIRQSAEFEVATYHSQGTVCENLKNIGLGTASSLAINDGNGWNRDTHCDGGDADDYYATETSTSPLHATNYRGIKKEFTDLFEIYSVASGGLKHSYYGSTHCHTTIGYLDSERPVIDVPVREMYRNIAGIMVRFLPVMKWLSMTNVRGARGAEGNAYDCLDADELYDWFERVQRNVNHKVAPQDEATDNMMYHMARGSSLRIHRRNTLHFENRMMDTCFSPTMMSAWLSLNRAIALFGYDMARNGYEYLPTKEEVLSSKQASGHHRNGWKNFPKLYLVSEWSAMKSYLYKYFKLSNSLDALEVLDKLIDCPVPQFLEDNNMRANYDPRKVEGHFNVRVREKDVELRDSYLNAIKHFLVPMAGSLNDFHSNVAASLGVQQKQAVSLYQMFKRENVDLEFCAGRLVYMGD